MDDVFDYLKKLEDDLLEQFRGKPHTEVLMKALARQLQEVYQFFIDLRDKRSLDTAEGQQLDGVGDIVVLSRDDARQLAESADVLDDMDDELYRRYLKYKVHINTNICTYRDVYKALKMFWDTTPLYYSEDPEWPATMFFSTPTLKPEDAAERLFRIPHIKAAGVALKIMATTETPIEPTVIRAAGAVFSGVQVTKLPQLVWEHHYKKEIHVLPREENVTTTILPPIT